MIDPEIIPGRMTLLVTLFLVLINIFNGMNSNSPVVNGFNAVSSWIFTCIVFVFAALVGYAGILLKKKASTRVSF